MDTKRSPQIDDCPIENELREGLDFGTAMNEVLNGKKVRRLEWKDEDVYLVMKNEQLMIFGTGDKILHPLIVSAGDIAGMDWEVVDRDKTVH